MSLVELRRASVTFHRGGRPFVALRPTDLVVEPGERLGIVGGSGSGKTTLARLILGLQHPAGGDVLFQGRSIVGLRERDRGWLRASASMVFQSVCSSLGAEAFFSVRSSFCFSCSMAPHSPKIPPGAR